MLRKPSRVFDRDIEWDHLVAFASPAAGRPQLGVVSGRRRQGKTYLGEALARKSGGCYFGATQATESESLRRFADAVGRAANATRTAAFPRLRRGDQVPLRDRRQPPGHCCER